MPGNKDCPFYRFLIVSLVISVANVTNPYDCSIREHPKCHIITAVLINISVLFVNEAVSPKVKWRHNKTLALPFKEVDIFGKRHLEGR